MRRILKTLMTLNDTSSQRFYQFHMYLYFSTITLNQLFFNDTSISPKFSFKYPSLPGYFFLPAHARIFPWAGKNKSGYRDGEHTLMLML